MIQTTSQAASSMGKWKAYPAYKDSGVEWLGEIPEHWEVKRLKYIALINVDVLPENTPSDYVIKYVDISNIDSNGTILDTQVFLFEDAPSRARRVVRDGDTIISTVRTYLRAIGHIENPPDNLIVSTGFAVLRPMPQVHPRFLWRLVQSDQFVSTVVAYSEGVGYPAINPSRLAALPALLPPLQEQRAISTFLDRETTKINALIAKKERMVELLREKRTALISHVVTKGLDSTVVMKDSGVEWLGEIPGHWEVKRLKFVATFFGGGTPSKDNLDYWSGDIPWVSPKDMKSEVIQDTEDHITRTAIVHSSTRLIQPGSVLIVVRSGILRHSIPVAINALAVAVNQDMKALILKPFLKPEYLASLIRGHQKALLVEWRKEGATVESIEYELLINTASPIPPLTEQQAIMEFIQQETAKIDALISRIQEGIEKLKEYSTALIGAAVTGKIDVRDESGIQDDEMQYKKKSAFTEAKRREGFDGHLRKKPRRDN